MRLRKQGCRPPSLLAILCDSINSSKVCNVEGLFEALQNEFYESSLLLVVHSDCQVKLRYDGSFTKSVEIGCRKTSRAQACHSRMYGKSVRGSFIGQVFALPFKRDYCIAIVQEAIEQP